MARSTKQLTDKEIKNAKPREKNYKLFDGGGLFLLITPKEKKLWRFKYRINTKEKLISLGSYPTIKLSDARKMREELKSQIANGIDPSEKRKEKKEIKQIEEEKIKNTFKFLTDAYFSHIATLEDAPKEATITRNKKRIENHCYPTLKNVPVDEITEEDILKILSILKEKEYHEIARRVLMFTKQILRYAVKRGLAKYNPAADITAKEEIGARVGKNYPVVTKEKELKELLIALSAYSGDPSTANALKIMPYLAFRPANIRFLEWDEVDFEKKVITIPASKMKMKRDFRSPMSKQAVKMFKEFYKYSGDGKYVFPSPVHKDKPLSENTLNVALRRLGYTRDQIVSHSFRGIFSTISHDKANQHKCSSLAIECQLAHEDANSIRGTYNRGDLLDERKKLMQWWADYLDGVKAAK